MSTSLVETGSAGFGQHLLRALFIQNEQVQRFSHRNAMRLPPGGRSDNRYGCLGLQVFQTRLFAVFQYGVYESVSLEWSCDYCTFGRNFG